MSRKFTTLVGPTRGTRGDLPLGWVLHPMASAVAAFLKSLALEPPIKTGTPDPYLPPKPGELRVEEHIQLGVIACLVRYLRVGGFYRPGTN